MIRGVANAVIWIDAALGIVAVRSLDALAETVAAASSWIRQRAVRTNASVVASVVVFVDGYKAWSTQNGKRAPTVLDRNRVGRYVTHTIIRNDTTIRVVTIRSVDAFADTLAGSVCIGFGTVRTQTLVGTTVFVRVSGYKAWWTVYGYSTSTHLD